MQDIFRAWPVLSTFLPIKNIKRHIYSEFGRLQVPIFSPQT